VQRFISVILSSLLLLSNMQLTFGQHFCEDAIIETVLTIGQKEMHCESDAASDSCCEEETHSGDCCTNVFHQIKTDKEFSVNYVAINFIPNLVSSGIDFYKFLEIEPYFSEEIPSYFSPPLPPWKQDILIFHQTFLI